MYLSRAVAAVSFFGALAIGTAVAWVAAGGETEAVLPVPTGSVSVTYTLAPMPARTDSPVVVQAEDLVGVWRGTWDHDQVPCTLEVMRIEGNRFYGILKENEAEVAFVGTIHEGDRRVFFHETQVIRLGAYGEWSLGTNSGGFSADGRTVSGTGVDRWGTYQWKLTKE